MREAEPKFHQIASIETEVTATIDVVAKYGKVHANYGWLNNGSLTYHDR